MDPAIAALPVAPPVAPMLAKAGPLPVTGDFQYDPKWDGFRCIVFRAGAAIELGSRNQRSLVRYFPEVLDPLRDHLPHQCVVDGELVVAGPDGLDFDALQSRLHPAESRVRMLAASTPAAFVAFDLLALDGDVRGEPLARRRELLVEAVAGAGGDGIHLSPATIDPTVAADWFERFEGAGLDGVIAKNRGGTYREGERGWIKVKHNRSADCVVGGFRWHKNGGVGSLLLGLFDADGRLHHIGVASGLAAKQRQELANELAPLVLSEAEAVAHPWFWHDPTTEGGAHTPDSGGVRLPGGVSRWTGDRDLSWVPLRPDLVCEVAYNQLQGRRLRHGARFLRWRPDRDPRSCSYDQLDTPVPAELARVFDADS